MPKITLYQKKQNLSEIGAQLKNVNDSIAQSASDPSVKSDVLNSLAEQKTDLETRFELLKTQIDADEKEAQERARQTPAEDVKDPKQKKIDKFAEMVRNVMNGQKITQEEFKQTMTGKTGVSGDNVNNGDALLPINVSSELISEPFAQNPLRNDASYSQIVNLILPRISVEFGDSFKAMADGAAAKEAEAKGDQIKFGRFESKVRIGITDTVLNGTNTSLVEYVNNALLNGASQYELVRAFTDTPETGEEHMNFYADANAIKKISAEDMYTGIKKALADLDDAYIDKAKIYMTRTDYYDIIEKLANGSTTLYGAQPEEVLGAPVVFTSRATKPVIGDFSQYQGNYDPTSSQMEQYKDYEKGINYFQVTLWYDANIRLASGFRIVDVAPKA